VPPNKSPEPTAVGPGRSAVADDVINPACLSSRFDESMTSKPHYLLVLLATTLLGISVSCDRNGFVSAYLRLREDSPLPSWVVLPAGTTRDQVSVAITIYEATTTPKWKVRFVIRDKRRWIFSTIQEQRGEGYWHPDSEREKAPAGTYPNWVIIDVGGKKDVYEQSEANDLVRIVKK